MNNKYEQDDDDSKSWHLKEESERMNPKFIDWANDLKFSEMVMYGNAHALQEVGGIFDRALLNETLIREPEETFQEFLMECFNREHGEEIQ